jgi:hypothetical protein
MSKSDSKQTAFCSILKYLQHKHPRLYDLVDELCIGGLFSPKRFGQTAESVTFVIPSPAELRELNIGDYAKSLRVLRSHILSIPKPENAPYDAGDFSRVCGTNSVLPSREKNVSISITCKSGTVMSGDKTKLTPAADFQPFAERRGGMSVWIADGPLSVGETPTAPKLSKKTAVTGKGDSAQMRAVITACITKCQSYESGLAHVSSLLSYIQSNCAAHYPCAIALIDYHPLSTMAALLTCPIGEICDAAREWFDNPELSPLPATQYAKHLEAIGTGGGGSVLETRGGPLNVQRELVTLRQHGCEKRDKSPIQVVEFVKKQYDNLNEHNKVGSLTNVYPAPLAAAFKARPGYKANTDRIRWLTTERTDFHSLCATIGNAAVTLLSSDQMPAFADPKVNTGAVMQTVNQCIVLQFICSQLFMYAPIPPGQLDSIRGATTDPDDEQILAYKNVSASLWECLQRIISFEKKHSS